METLENAEIFSIVQSTVDVAMYLLTVV